MHSLFGARPAAAWDREVNALGVPLAICRSIDDFLRHDPPAAATAAVIDLDDPLLGPTCQLGYPVTLSATPPRASHPRQIAGTTDPHWLRPRDPTRPGRRMAIKPGDPPLTGFRVVDMS